MKLIIISDSHGRYERIAELIELHRDADALVFLGDGVRDLYRAGAYSSSATVYAVKGNCDFSSVFVPDGQGNVPNELVFSLDGFRFYAIHGHTKGVKMGLDSALAAAVGRGADVLLFGHTHEPLEKYFPEGANMGGRILDRPLYLFNPGSLGESHDGRAHFGLVEIRDGNILFSHGTL